MVTNKPSEILPGHAEIFMRSDNIIQVNGTDHTYTVEDIRAINKAVGLLTDNKKTLTLFVASKYSLVDSEARLFMSTDESTMYSIAEAYVIKSFPQRLILNFILKVSGFKVPAKFFDEIEPAIEWLKEIEYKKLSA